uniref:NADH-ubiquinone oxidoreductase chain 6 n=1 Tax=Pyrearinus termitilluminans TaxID=109589 RepID=A0A161UI33_9COLE|nr:NADH dehydrogenase subunit 6 [Pyrearinus termitilluminans]AIQ80132.1 NADH dehydrogenase subunit 6 [Pyrearinus termitilluminans]
MASTLYILTLATSLTFAMVEHPLSMGLILLSQTTLIALITGLMAHNSWFSYILFMIMIGGMLVLFIYMTSVASNEKFAFSNKLAMTTLTIMPLTALIMLTDKFFSYQPLLNTDTSPMTTNILYSMSMSKYLNFPLNSWMITMIVYLLMALIAVVKITNVTYGPLRQKT